MHDALEQMDEGGGAGGGEGGGHRDKSALRQVQGCLLEWLAWGTAPSYWY